MKIAILGRSPQALEAALRFHLHGAAFTWFVEEEQHSYFTSGSWDATAFTSDLGLSVLKEVEKSYSPKTFSWTSWSEQYEAPLISYLKSHQEVNFHEVASVAKRFLAPKEVIPNRSRFLDLFRVIYKVDPREFIEEQKESNPETYNRLTEEFINSLTTSVEMYQDFDLVLDLRNDLSKASVNATGRALGESRKTDKVHYGLGALDAARNFVSSPELRELALIGSDSLSCEILLSLETWLKDPKNRLFVASHEESPYEAFLKTANKETSEKLNKLFEYMENEFQKEVNDFTKKLHEWQELDDFVQVKIPKPAEPIPRLNFFSAHNVSAIDELIDKKRMFLTLECPDFRTGRKHSENNFIDLKTIGVDQVLVAHTKKEMGCILLDDQEPGYFALTPARPVVANGWEADLEKLKGIEDEIFKLFSPVDSH